MREESFRLSLPALPWVITVTAVLLSEHLFHCCDHVLVPAKAWSNDLTLRKTFGSRTRPQRQRSLLLLRRLNEGVAGSFFNPIPEPNETNSNTDTKNDVNEDDVHWNDPATTTSHASTSQPSKALQPSTINGIPSELVGWDLGMTIQAARQKDPITRKPFVGIGPSSLNDVTKPEYDDQGYTLYVDERTGSKARVFEALVDYPCLFTLKIVGANDATFVQDVLQIVASTCEVMAATTDNDEKELSESSLTSSSSTADINQMIEHTIKYNGKWASITVQAPVQSAQMLYQLYENVDRDPRVKFKF